MLGHLTIQLLWATAGLLVTRFIVLSTQWMKEMRTWGRSEITSFCFFVWCESSSLLWLKTPPRSEGSISWIVSAKISELGGEIEMSAGWWHFMSLILPLYWFPAFPTFSPWFPAFPPWFPTLPPWFPKFPTWFHAFPPWFPAFPLWFSTFPSWFPTFPSFPSFRSPIPHPGFYR